MHRSHVFNNQDKLAITESGNLSSVYLHQKTFDSLLQANIIFIVADGRIIRASKEACKILGYSKRDLLVMNRDDIFDVSEDGYKKMLQKQNEATSYKAVHSLRNKNGKFIPCEINSIVLNDENGISICVFTIQDMTRLKRSAESPEEPAESQEKKISEAVMKAKEMERLDIGKELHDNINQLLGTSILYLQMARNDIHNSDIYLGHSSEYTVRAIEEIRKLTKGLTNAGMDDFELYASIETMCLDTMQIYPVKISCTLDPVLEKSMSNAFQLNVYRILQEKLNNILKHARASSITIAISQSEEGLLLVVEDDGIGFDTRDKSAGIGIKNIKNRAELFKGAARFESGAGNGCKLTVTFPALKL